MSQRSFRTRLFLALFFASLVPVAVIFAIGWMQVQRSPWLHGNVGLDSLAGSWRAMDSTMRAIPGTPRAAEAASDFNAALEGFLRQSQLAIYDYTHTFLPQTLTLLLLGVLLGGAIIVLLGRRLTRQLSAPLDELVEWTDVIRRRGTLPTEDPRRRGHSREFVVLQKALREMQRDLNVAAAAQIESERLRAFGEVARRVAHEMKNPLTPIRLAVVQMGRHATPEQREMLDIIAAESARLEAMAREFAQLGRLPDGVAAPVDLRELLDELLRSTVPGELRPALVAGPDAVVIDGYYDPLRRAFSNLLRNAVEACHGEGAITVRLAEEGDTVVVTISDTGHGIAEDRREMIFQPYFTDKGDGTGLGLAIVKQTVEQHRGTIGVSDTPGGGATFTVRFPRAVP